MNTQANFLATIKNPPFAQATLLEDKVGGKKFLFFRTGYAAVVLVYKKTDSGQIELMLIKERRGVPDGTTATVLKTIGGFKRRHFNSDSAFIAHLIQNETGYRLSEQGKKSILVIGDFPDFEIAEFPIKEVIVDLAYLTKSNKSSGSSEVIWMTLEKAAKLATEGKFGDAAAEVMILRFFAMLKLNLITL